MGGLLIGKRIYRAVKDKGKGVLRAGEGVLRAGYVRPSQNNNNNNNNNNNKNIIRNVFRIQAYDSIMCGYFLYWFYWFYACGKNFN